MAAGQAFASHYLGGMCDPRASPGGALLSSDRSSNELWLVQLKEQLKQQRYSLQATWRRIAVAKRFLAWLEDRATQQGLLGLTVVDVDAYMIFRARSQRRSSVRFLATNVRSFLRCLNASGRTAGDLSTTVIGPTLYAFESIPSSLRP